MEIVKSFLTQNPCYKAGKKIGVAGRACVNAFINADTGKIYQETSMGRKGSIKTGKEWELLRQEIEGVTAL